MDDITGVMNAYRDCIRHIWNAYFASDARANPDWNAIEDFWYAAGLLFRALVFRRIGHEEAAIFTGDDTLAEPLAFVRIEVDPRGEILINREQSGGYWDFPLTTIEKGDLELHFLGFFDWDVTNHRDIAYYRTRIANSTKYPQVVGKDALVPIAPHVRVIAV